MSDDKNKPVLDEQTFQKLLEAAHVLQQRGDMLRELQKQIELPSDREQGLADQPSTQPTQEASAQFSPPKDYTLTLAEIVETQRQIQVRHLGLDAAMALIAEKVMRMTHASGVGIGILDGKIVRYRAAAGSAALPVGTEVPLATAVCNICVLNGQVTRSDDLNIEMQFDPEPCLQRGILSLLSVPVYHDGEIAGTLELYFDKVHGYTEQDVHTSQLLAGTVTEALGRDAELKLKRSMVEERSSMLATIEKLQPNLAALADESSRIPEKSNGKEAATPEQTCWKCGTKMPAVEQFCGHCGAVLTHEGETRSMQSKIASAWQRHQISAADSGPGKRQQPQPLSPTENAQDASVVSSAAVSVSADAVPKPHLPSKAGESVPVEYSDPFLPRSRASNDREEPTAAAFSQESELHNQPDSGGSEDEKEVTVEKPSPLVKSDVENQVWSSAAKTREFLEKVAGSQKTSRLTELWEAHRGDFYLVLAVLLVLVVIRWGLGSHHSVGATGRGNQVGATSNHQPAPDADLSLFDKLLIGLGLAEAPEAPPEKGNPDVQVWVDPHTALYYCPGADLFGKTPKGKLTTQRNAQLDQFEPASRTPCE